MNMSSMNFTVIGDQSFAWSLSYVFWRRNTFGTWVIHDVLNLVWMALLSLHKVCWLMGSFVNLHGIGCHAEESECEYQKFHLCMYLIIYFFTNECFFLNQKVEINSSIFVLYNEF